MSISLIIRPLLEAQVVQKRFAAQNEQTKSSEASIANSVMYILYILKTDTQINCCQNNSSEDWTHTHTYTKGLSRDK